MIGVIGGMTLEQGKVCETCGGEGFLKVNQETWKRCRCSFSKALRERVGVEIATAPYLNASPLFVPGEPGEPAKVDKTLKNVFLKGWWGDLVSHLKYTLVWKNFQHSLHYYMQMVTDERLKAIYLGKESYTVKSKESRDRISAYNTLSDIIGPEQHLVIIQLGFLGHKNVAMPGILKEALLMRQAANRPTWIIENPDSLFTYGHFAYSEDVWDYIKARFEFIDLTKERGVPYAQRGVAGSEFASEPGMSTDADDVSVEEEPEPQRPPPRPRPEESSPVTNSLMGGSKKKKPYKGGNR